MKGFMNKYTPEEIKAAHRFMETCEDGEGYDVPKQMMRRLAEIGLVRHVGGGYYEATEQMHKDIVQ